MYAQTMVNRFTSVLRLAPGSAVALSPFPEVVKCRTHKELCLKAQAGQR